MVFLIFLLACALRVALFHRSLAYDETYSYLAFVKSGFFESYHYLYNATNHLLNTFFTAGFIRLLGVDVVAIRLSAFLFGLASIVAVYFIFMHLLDRRSALLGSFLLAISSYHIRYSTESRGYTAFLFFALLAAWNFLDAIHRRRLLPWILFTASFILAAFSNLFALILFVPFAFFLLVTLLVERDWHSFGYAWMALVTSGLGILLLYAPTLPLWSYMQSVWHTGRLPSHAFDAFVVEIYPFDGTFLMDLLARLGWGGGWRLILCVALAILGAVLSYRQGRWREATLFMFLLGMPLVVAKATGIITVYRLFFYAIPFYLYFIVRAIFWLQDRCIPKFSRSRYVVMPALLVFAFLFASPLLQYLRGEGSLGVEGDWRRGLAYVRQHYQADDFVTGDPLGEPASQEGMAVQFYWGETVEGGKLEPVLDGEIGVWRLQFESKPDPEGFSTAIFEAKDMKIFYRRQRVAFSPIWSSKVGNSLSLVFYGRDGSTRSGKFEAFDADGFLAFTIPRGMRKAVLTSEKVDVRAASPFVLALQGEGDIEGSLRVQFFRDDFLNFNLDMRRFKGGDGQSLYKAFSWRYADTAQVVLEVRGSLLEEVFARIRMEWYTSDEI